MKPLLRSIYLYLGLGLALATGAILAVMAIAAQRENATSRATQEAVVRYETEHLYSAMAGKLTPEIFWQDAYDNSAKGWNQKWVDFQFGPYLDSIAINVVVLLDGSGRILHTYTHGLDKPPRRARIGASEDVQELSAAVLKAPPLLPPHPISATVDIDGVFFVAAGGLITPETAAQMPISPRNKRVLLFLTRLTPASYATLQRGFDVGTISIGRTAPDPAGLADVELHDASGHVAARLWWSPSRPGTRLVERFAPWCILVFLLLAGMQTAALRRWLSLQGALYRAEAKAEFATEESRAKSAFLGTISHELRTPLNAILGFSEVLRKKPYGTLGSPRYEEYVDDIHASGLSLLEKVNDLIEIARIETHDTALERLPTEIESMVCEAIQTVDGRAAASNVTLRCVADVEPLWCLAAPISLRLILIRLLTNAIQFSRAGGAVEVLIRSSEKGAEIAIRDYGMGIPLEHLNRLGKPFVQVDSHLVRRHDGVGLGLAISKGLMALMDGRLEIESRLGKGTTVTLHLPATEAPPAFDRRAA